MTNPVLDTWIDVAHALAAATKEAMGDDHLDPLGSSTSAGFHLVLDKATLDDAPRLKHWRDAEGNLHVVGRWDVQAKV